MHLGCCAGKAHDVMALKCRGVGSPLNFGLGEYQDLLPMLPNLTKVGLLMLGYRPLLAP